MRVWLSALFLVAVFSLPGRVALGEGKLPAVTVMVVDVQAALQQSQAARSARIQRDQFLQSIQGELEASRKALKDVENELVRLKPTLPPEQWQVRARSFEQQVFEFNQRFQRGNQAVEKSFRTAMGEVSDALNLVTEEVASELGANLVLPKAQIVMHDPRMEVTAMIVERLNKKLPNAQFPVPVPEGEAANNKPQSPAKKK